MTADFNYLIKIISVIAIIFLLSGCSTNQQYPPDLIGELQPINTNETFKLMIERPYDYTNNNENANATKNNSPVE